METALLGFELPQVLKLLKEMLIRRGFLVQTMPTPNPVILAFQEGRWYRSPRQLVLEISSVEKNCTRIDVTAIIDAKKKSRHAEEVIEENFVSAIYQNIKSTIHTHHGIR